MRVQLSLQQFQFRIYFFFLHLKFLILFDVPALEQFYQIKFDFNDIVEMGTVGKIREKMKKYDVFVEN